MDHAGYHVVYVDARISADLDGKTLQKPTLDHRNGTEGTHALSWEDRNADCPRAMINEVADVRDNLKRLLHQFNGVYTCNCDKSCMANLRRLDSASPVPNPTIVFSGTTFASQDAHPPTAVSADVNGGSGLQLAPADDFALLKNITYEIAKGNLSKLVIPVAVIFGGKDNSNIAEVSTTTKDDRITAGNNPIDRRPNDNSAKDGSEAPFTISDISILMDAGAIDVLESPLQEPKLQSLIIQTYRFHKEALRERAIQIEKKKSRKLSWLGNTEHKPYAYLREKMVSDLMTGICNPDQHFHLGSGRSVPALDPDREAYLKENLGSWSYWGHEYSEDELIHAAAFMLKHALSLPELEPWRISTDKLMSFLMASRAAYNNFVDYHNFKHVIDVMQASFYFFIQLGILPKYPVDKSIGEVKFHQSPLASLLRPLEVLTLLITAIGHDVGHPGVNNAFLVALNAPLAQLYNDRSVLEAFHCAAFSQILRRYWRTSFESSEMRSLMINSILATDMGVHQKYMTDLGHLQDKLHHQPDLDGYSAQQLEEFRILVCALLIKCADISNVARPYDVAVQWAGILQLEFANQGVMENEVGIPSTLFGGPPELHNVIKLGNSQKSFMNFFAQPLFESVADVLPAMTFTTEELKSNQNTWAERIRLETERKALDQTPPQSSSGMLSPRSRSPEHVNGSSELSISEGLPASNPSGDDLRRLSVSQSQAASSLSMSPPTDARSSNTIQDLGDSSLSSANQRRRSSQSHNKSLTSSGAGADTNDFSRRSSGALSSTSNANTMLAPRRTNNSSPSQLQLVPETRNASFPSSTNSENRMPNGRVSEETLSQMHAMNSASSDITSRHDTKDPYPNVNHTGIDLKVIDTIGANTAMIPRASTDETFENRGDNRSSSGAHTNNTSVSQSTPYSPAGTQATSMLTVDSDSKSAHGRVDSLTDRAIAMHPFAPLSDPRDKPVVLVQRTSATVEATAPQMKPFLIQNNCLLNGFEGPEQNSVRRKKSSKFNFLPWKKRGKSDQGH